jgi:hypothetical protein
MEVADINLGERHVLDKALAADIEMIRATLEQTSREGFRRRR